MAKPTCVGWNHAWGRTKFRLPPVRMVEEGRKSMGEESAQADFALHSREVTRWLTH